MTLPVNTCDDLTHLVPLIEELYRSGVQLVDGEREAWVRIARVVPSADMQVIVRSLQRAFAAGQGG